MADTALVPGSELPAARVAATTYGVDPFVAAAAAANLASGALRVVAVSGHMGSGKDWWAPKIMELLGVADTATPASFAHPMKSEVNTLLEIVGSCTPQVAAERVADVLDWDLEHAHRFVGIVEPFRDQVVSWDAHRRDLLPADARGCLRALLQDYGTARRIHTDELYWVSRAADMVCTQVAAGRSVYLTDVRFPNEADLSLALGWDLIRLDITDEVQQQRLLARDGVTYDLAALTHPSETALDDYPFPVRIDNSGSEVETLRQLAARYGPTATAA